jgi:diketogulonate reductase-like aldo/keto reductase
MNIISIHIDEALDDRRLSELKEDLAQVPHVARVEFSPALPHDLMVEYEERHNVPVMVLARLAKQGLHSDIQYC